MLPEVSGVTERKHKIKRALQNIGVGPETDISTIILSHFEIAVQKAYDAGRESALHPTNFPPEADRHDAPAATAGAVNAR